MVDDDDDGGGGGGGDDDVIGALTQSLTELERQSSSGHTIHILADIRWGYIWASRVALYVSLLCACMRMCVCVIHMQSVCNPRVFSPSPLLSLSLSYSERVM